MHNDTSSTSNTTLTIWRIHVHEYHPFAHVQNGIELKNTIAYYNLVVCFLFIPFLVLFARITIIGLGRQDCTSQ